MKKNCIVNSFNNKNENEKIKSTEKVLKIQLKIS